jgi:hypothetical protein
MEGRLACAQCLHCDCSAAQSATLRAIAAADLLAVDPTRDTASFIVLYTIDSFTLVASTRGW